ncbi:MAG: hypothetical protein IPG67_08460 [Acidobacteria bacterium]|nr:hypothetical protein [Acidobacteriota bacterium]
MTYHIDSKSTEVVDGFGSVGRWIQLIAIALVCIALPANFYFIFEGKKDDPFDPKSEFYPALVIFIFAVPVILFGYCFYVLRKGFRQLYIDDTEHSMQVTWQGLWGEWNETIPFTAIRGFSVERVAISRYEYGWELRAVQQRGHYVSLAKFYKEEAALDALRSVNSIFNK